MREVLTGAANLSPRPTVTPSLGPRGTLTPPTSEFKSTIPIIPTITPETAKPTDSFFNTVEYKPAIPPSLDTIKPALNVVLDKKVADPEILSAPKVEVVSRETFNKPVKGFQFKEGVILWEKPKDNPLTEDNKTRLTENLKTDAQDVGQKKLENQAVKTVEEQLSETKLVQKGGFLNVQPADHPKAPFTEVKIEEVIGIKITEVVKTEISQIKRTYQALVKAHIPDKEAEEMVRESLSKQVTKKLPQDLKEAELLELKNKVNETIKGIKEIPVVKQVQEIDFVFERDPKADQERVKTIEEAAESFLQIQEVVTGPEIANSLPSEDQNPKLASEIVKERRFGKLIDGSLTEIKRGLGRMGQFIDKLSVIQTMKALVKYFPAVRIRARVTTEPVTQEDVRRVVQEMDILASTL